MIIGSALLFHDIQVAVAQQEFLCSVSHCCDNVTRPLSQDDDTGSSTDEYELYDVDDNTQPPVTNSSNTTAAASAVVTSTSASCDVCLVPPHVKVALIPCGHATFCQQCIDYRHANCLQFPLSRVSRCNIYYRAVLQLDMKHR